MLAGIGAFCGAEGCASRPKHDPDRSYALFQVAVSSYEANRLEAAVQEAHQALKADPQNAEAHNLLGIIALRHGADYLSQARTLDCLTGPDADLVQADAMRKFREAHDHFKHAVAAQDDSPDAWNNLAAVALHLQDWDLAEEAATQALKTAGYNQPYVAQANRGWAYYHRGDLQKAWKDLHDAVTRQPAFCVGRYRLAKVYVDRGQLDQAAEQIDAIVAEKRCPIQEAFLLGGLVEQKRKNGDRALDFLEQCVSLAPKSCVAGQCRRYTGIVN